MPTYLGTCHCGAIRFEVTGELQEVTLCNCSLCARNAFLHWEVEPKQFQLHTSDEVIQDYQFGTMTSHNFFCKTCGISAFRRSRTSPDQIDINVRCLQGVDADALEIERFDGKNWDEAYAASEFASNRGKSNRDT